MGALRLVDGKLRPSTDELKQSLLWTSQGLDEIVIDQYDAFVLVGLGLSFTTLARMYGQLRVPCQSKELPYRRLISQQVFDLALEGQVRNSLSLVIARLLRHATEAPILIIPDPMPAERAQSSKEATLWRHLAVSRDGTTLRQCFYNQSEACALQVRADILFQPERTMAGVIFSRDELCKGATRLREDEASHFDDNEFGHLGPQYGVEMISALRGRLNPSDQT